MDNIDNVVVILETLSRITGLAQNYKCYWNVYLDGGYCWINYCGF